ncbi:MAG: hypothetical protein HY869_17725 [Chloroflexi bacterium]|nr:hypothetical protein [Chloroflexota bacterium]
MLKFLKPSLLKIVVALVLFLGLTWLWGLKNMFIMDASFHGVPLTYFTVWGPCQVGQNCSEFNNVNFALDIVFWYLVSAFGVELIQRWRRKP